MNRAVYLGVSFYLVQSIEAINIVQRLVYGEWDGQGGNKIGQLANLLFIVVSTWLFVRSVRRISDFRTGAFLALGAAGLLLASAIWSLDPETTVRRGISYLFMVLGAIGIAGTMDGDAFMALLARVCSLSAVASLVLLVLSPANALMPDPNGSSFILRGIFSHKNTLGPVMAMGALAVLHVLQTSERRRPLNFAILGLFLIVTLLSHSATSLMLIVFFSLGHIMAFLFRKGPAMRAFGVVLAAVSVPIVSMLLIFPDFLLGLLGKDPTLTGRSVLWELVMANIADKPVFGWGYGAFWLPINPAAYAISSELKWIVPEAHNGILQLLLDVGIVGCGFFVFLWARNIYAAWRRLQASSNAVAVSGLLCCGGIFLLGISETVLLEPYQIATSLFFITGFMTEKALRTACAPTPGPRRATRSRAATLRPTRNVSVTQ